MAGIVHVEDILLPNGKSKPWDFFTETDLNSNNYLLILGLSLNPLQIDSWRVLVNSTQMSEQTTTNSDFSENILYSNNVEIY